MARKIKMGNMEMTLRHGTYDRNIMIETDKCTVIIRSDGTVHVMTATSTTAYKANNEKVRVE